MDNILTGEIITLWEGLGQNDSDYGNSPYYTVGFFLTEEEATEATKNSGNWGSTGKVRAIQAIKSGELYFKFSEIEVTIIKLDDFVSEKIEDIRKAALTKLTFIEKKVLGL